MDGVGGYAGWRWIFILEGLLTVLVAFVAPFAIHDSPETATFLTEKERKFVLHSLRIQNTSDSHEMVAKDDKFQWRYVYDAFADWQIWLGLFSKLCASSPVFYCFPKFGIVANISQCTGVSHVRYMAFPFSCRLSSRI